MLDIWDFFRARPKKRSVRLRSKKGVLFSNPSGPKKVIFYAGTVLFVFGIFYILYLYQPLLVAIGNFASLENKETISREEVAVLEEEVEESKEEVTDDYYVIIPNILASARIELGLDPFDKVTYLYKLKDGVIGQSNTSSLPGAGLGKSVFLFAHSTEQGIVAVRNNAVFYLLGELNEGDPIFIRQGKQVYTYIVYKQIVVNPDEIEYLEYSEDDKEVLILQTCWPIGTNWKRLLVLAKRV